LALSALLMAGCLEPESLALNYEVYELRADGESQVTSGCSELEDGLGFGFGTGPDPSYSVEYGFRSDGVSLTVSGDEGVLAERDYSEGFLASGETDEFVVPVSDDVALRFVNTGSVGCGDDLGGIGG
jgi:hypothetical protein